MKSLILLLLSVLVFSSKFDDERLFKDFQEYMVKYNKNYSTAEEMLKRFEIFKQNKKRTLLLSAIPKSKTGARFGENKFSDMTEEEFKKRYLNLDIEALEEFAASEEVTNAHFDKNKKIPSSWDWRDKKAVTPVVDQDGCGSCWAHSTSATLASQYLIHGKNITSFSVQQLIDCDMGNKGCGGGLMNKGYDYLKTSKLMLTEDYPYEKHRGECRYDESKGIGKVKSYQRIISEDEDEMKVALYEKGPLAAGLFSFPLMFYSGGIFDPLFSFLCPATIDHAVTIVGYGSEWGVPYWLIKNSWGTDWGEDGYFRIRAGSGTCGINTFVFWVEADLEE
ncbi:MAG: C1 family peptidase [archaeon]|nr:C1 family peptidase [archaeon]